MRSFELFLLQALPNSAERVRFPALRRFLSRSRACVGHASVEGTLLERFGVHRQRDWPVAPFARLGDGETPDDAYWLAADPVHLRVDRDALLLVDASRFGLDRAHAGMLVEALNRHFDGSGMQFSAPTPKRWYVRLARAPDIETVPLGEALGRNVDVLLPRGGEALAWHRTFNEIQMLLHNHPLNEEREEQGELPFNSVWFWGGGHLPSGVRGRWKHVWADDALPRGLSVAAGIEVSDIPRDFAQWAEHAQDGDHLAVLGQSEFDLVESDWIAPALQALRKGQLGEIRLSAPAGTEMCCFGLGRTDLWKFWRSTAAASA